MKKGKLDYLHNFLSKSTSEKLNLWNWDKNLIFRQSTLIFLELVIQDHFLKALLFSPLFPFKGGNEGQKYMPVEIAIE